MSRDRTPFGARLLAARKHAKLTQEEACAMVGISQSTLAGLEKEALGSSKVSEFARAYGVNVNWLATGEGDMHDVMSWPLPMVPRERYEALSADERAYVQGEMMGAIRQCERARAANRAAA